MIEECGLGKTIQQLLWAEQIVLKERRPVLLLCPIGVRQQTIREASRFLKEQEAKLKERSLFDSLEVSL